MREFCISGAWGIMLSCLDGKGRTNVRVGYSQKGGVLLYSRFVAASVFLRMEKGGFR